MEDIVTFGIAHVPEGRGVITELTVEENLRLGALWRSDRRRATVEGLATVYEMFPPLAERRGKAADTLSGGERQMLAIGRALMSRPTLLLARRAFARAGAADNRPDHGDACAASAQRRDSPSYWWSRTREARYRSPTPPSC